jgi:hypothetical protein
VGEGWKRGEHGCVGGPGAGFDPSATTAAPKTRENSRIALQTLVPFGFIRVFKLSLNSNLNLQHMIKKFDASGNLVTRAPSSEVVEKSSEVVENYLRILPKKFYLSESCDVVIFALSP